MARHRTRSERGAGGPKPADFNPCGFRWGLVAVLAAGLGACRHEEPPDPAFPKAPAAAELAAPEAPANPHVRAPAAPQEPASAAMPQPAARTVAQPAEPPPQPASAAPAPPSDPSKLMLHDLVLDVPAGWTLEPASNPMRIAQYRWPSAAEDAEAPWMVVFFFGAGSGGGVDANLDRWRAQFDEPGTPSPGRTERFENAHAKFTLLDKWGTFKQQASMMSPEFTPKAGWRMLAAVVEVPGGPYFFRVTGPQRSVAAQRDALVAMLKSLRPAGGGS